MAPFHGGNTGSIPVGRASDFNNLSLLTDLSLMTYGKSTAYLLAFGERPFDPVSLLTICGHSCSPPGHRDSAECDVGEQIG